MFKPSLLTLAVSSALSGVLFSSNAVAQEQVIEKNKSLEVIEVTATRRYLALCMLLHLLSQHPR